MSDLKIGFVPLILEPVQTGTAPRWTDVKRWSQLAEASGFDTVWLPDELVWENAEAGTVSGWWECVAMTSAIAASTSTIDVGSWVLSALHRNPGLTAKVAETLDEISNGRFILGLGAGHSGRQGEAFGYPPDKVVGRYVEALEIVLPLLQDGSANFSGQYHSAVNQPARPRGPRPGKIPLMLAGHGPRTMGIAVKHADIWSGYATTSSQPSAFVEMLEQLDRICDDAGRDPLSIGRSIGIGAEPPGAEPGPMWANDDPVVGSFDEIVETLVAFKGMGVTSIELMFESDPDEGIPAFAPIIEAVKGA